jgi:RNA polymerase sigma factor (sigma-70 family)
VANRIAAAVRKLKRVDPGVTDQALLDRHAAGDGEAFAALVHRHGKVVLAACRHVLADPADIDDAFQATFVVLLKLATGQVRPASLGAWLYGVAHRVAVRTRSDRARRARRETVAAERRSAEVDSPDWSWREAVAVLHEELDRLPDQYRRVLLHCYLQGQSRDEAAAGLGLRPGAVKGLLERGRGLLARRLARRGITLSAGLLAVLTGHARGAAGGPSLDLIDRMVRASGGPVSPAVSALAHGAFPMFSGLKPFAAAAATAVLLLAVALTVGPATTGPAANADEKPARRAENKDAAKAAGQAKQAVIRVLDPDGKPVIGATVYRRVDPDGRGRPVETVVGKTNTAGELESDRPPFARFHAVAPGYPAAACDTRTEAPALVIRLAKPLPIKGRLVNLQGKPIPNARAVVESVSAAENDDLAAAYDASRVNQDLMHHALPVTLDGKATGAPGGATTDADGRFELPDVGRMRVTHLRFEADGIETARVTVFADPEFARRMKPPTDAERKHSQLNGYVREPTFGPEFTYTARPEHVITGTVTDGVTGKPVAGITVAGTASDLGSRFLANAWHDKVETKTDAAGRFRLTGLAKADKRFLHATGTDAAPYLDRAVEVADVAGYAPVTADVKLQPAVVVRGRLVNQATGKPVSGVAFWYALNADGRAKVGGDIYFNYTRTRPSGTVADAGPDGRFALRIPPGPGVILAHADSRDLTTAFTPVRVRDEDRKYLRKPEGKPDRAGNMTQPREGEEFFDATSYRVPIRGLNGYAIVAPDSKARSHDVTVEFDPGATVTLNAIDPEGKPLGGVTAVGPGSYTQRPTTFTTPEIAVGGIDPKGRPVQLYLLHSDRNLCAAVTLKGDEKGAVAVKMRPSGRVTGRVVDHAGKPVEGAQVRFFMTDAVADELIRTRLYRWSEEVCTDAEGKFSFPRMFPDVEFLLAVNLPGHRTWATEPARVNLKPGEAKDVGEFKCRDPKHRGDE